MINEKLFLMNLSTKKIIAREFLILAVVLLLSLFAGICIYPYNFYKQNQINAKNDKIHALRKKSDSLSLVYNEKKRVQKIFFNSASLIFGWSESYQDLWKLLGEKYHNGSIPVMYNRVPSSDFVKFLKSEGYDNSEAFEKFLSENLLTKSDSLNYLESEKTDQIIFGVIIESNHIKEKMIDSDEHMKFFAQVLAILFSIAYPIRFFALGVKWSLGIINQKNTDI